MESSMEVGRTFYGSRSNGSRWTLMEVLWKELEVCDTHGSRWGIWKLMENSTEYIRGSCHWWNQWRLPLPPTVETLLYFHGSFYCGNPPALPWKLPLSHGNKSTSTNLHGNFHASKSTSTDLHGSKLTSIEVDWPPSRFRRLSWKLPWK